jgi:adenylate cyclase
MKGSFKASRFLNSATITFCLTLFVLLLFISGVPILDYIELKSFDLRFISRGVLPPSTEVVIAAIDEKSLRAEGRWPWPRSKLAKLIDILSEEGAKVVSFDVLFSEPDENTHLQFINELDERLKSLPVRDSSIHAFIDQSRRFADNDLALATSIRNASAKVVLGYFFHMSDASLGYELTPEEIRERLQGVSHSRYPVTLFAKKEMDADPFIHARTPQPNLSILAEAAASSGFFNMVPDPDGVVRWMPLVIKTGGDLYAPLPILSLWHYMDDPPLMVRVEEHGVEGIRMGPLFIPTDERGQILINYLGPTKTFPHYAITDILNRKTPAGTFSGKIVLVGATSTGIYDMRNTPFETVFPGVEIHATVIENILSHSYLYKPAWTRLYDALAILLLSVLAGMVIPRLSALKGILFAAGLFILHILVAQWLFENAALWVNMVYPLLGLVLVYTSLTIYRYLTEERERKKIREAFSHYVSGSVVNEMLRDPERLKLGGEKKDLTVLFADIRGFTSMAETLEPEALVELLNEFHTAMTDVVYRYDGTLDKYIGDAIMVVYGAPLEFTDHASRGCNSALDMIARLKELNEKWVKEGKPALDIGVGINTGLMMVGNMGSQQRFDYTVMGDAVNLASRLEGANKLYHTNIVISESTCERVKDEFTVMELDSVRVKGKVRPVKIYELAGRNDVPAPRKEAIQCFRRGLSFYKKQQWDEAIEAFRETLTIQKNMQVAALYIERADMLKTNPPTPDWDGTFTMRSK